MTSKITCCYHCNTRCQGCHSNCKRYQQQKQQLEEFKKKQREEKKVNQYFGDSVRRCKNLNKGKGNFISALNRSV